MNANLKNDGLSYVGDEGTMSVYAIRSRAETIAYVLVDNENPISAEDAAAVGLKAPEDATLHRIYVATADRKVTLETTGMAAKIAHIDGEGVSAPHIDGMTVAQYLAPRVVHWLGKLLLARSEV